MNEILKLPADIFLTATGTLLMILNSLLWQKISSIEKNSRTNEKKIYELEARNTERMEESERRIMCSIKEILDALHLLEVRMSREYINKDECAEKHTERRKSSVRSKS